MNATNRRNEAVDVARGIAILLVIAGHVFPAPAKTIIYVFHMPFFFFLGGYFFRAGDGYTVFKKRFHKLIIPFISFFLVLICLQISINVAETGSAGVWDLIWPTILGGEAMVMPYTVFWFPTCFFFCMVAYNYMEKSASSNMLLAVVVIFVLGAIANQIYFPNFWLPYALNVCLMAIPMVFIGNKFGSLIFSYTNSSLLVSAVAVALYIYGVLFFNFPGMDMKTAEYGIPFVTLGASIAFSVALVWCARHIGKVPYLSGGLQFCGLASMTLMYVQMPAKMIFLKVGIHNPWLLFVLMSAASILAHVVLSRTNVTRRLFLGEGPKPSKSPKLGV